MTRPDQAERVAKWRERRRQDWLGLLLDQVFEAIDAFYNMTHDESADEVRAATGLEPTDRAVNKVFVMAFADMIAGKSSPGSVTVLDVHNRMAEVAKNLGLRAKR